MACIECDQQADVADLTRPYILRTCARCGRQIKLPPRPGRHGIGIEVSAGDQLVMPAGSITLSANPLASSGYLSRHGLKWFSENVFMGGFSAASDGIVEHFQTEIQEIEEMISVSEILGDLDLSSDNESDKSKFEIRMSETKDHDDWWLVYFHGFADMALEAIKEGDATKAAWAASAAHRAKSIILFKNYFRDVVWMGHSANRLLNLLRIWDNNKGNNDEEFWQIQFEGNQFAFSQLFSVPVTFVSGKAYVGGMSIEHKDAKFVDFLLAGGTSNDAILVEIKVPGIKLIGGKYRRGIYGPSTELSGAIVQTQNYKTTLIRELDSITRQSEHTVGAINPKSIIIAGTYDQLDTKEKVASFELFRSSLSGVEILTFDEFFKKLEYLLAIFGLKRS